MPSHLKVCMSPGRDQRSTCRATGPVYPNPWRNPSYSGLPFALLLPLPLSLPPFKKWAWEV